MNRRAFLGALLGVGAAAATEAVAPSLVWPFRKYFLPSNWMRWVGIDVGCIPPGSLVTTQGFTHLANNGIWQVTDAEVTLYDKTIPDLYGHGISEAAVEAIELEAFAKEIPDLIYKNHSFYEFFKQSAGRVSSREATGAMAQFQESVDRISLGTKTPMRMRIPMRPASDVPITAKMVNGNIIEMPRKGLLHKKATVENIVRFVDDLQSKS